MAQHPRHWRLTSLWDAPHGLEGTEDRRECYTASPEAYRSASTRLAREQSLGKESRLRRITVERVTVRPDGEEAVTLLILAGPREWPEGIER